jgi:subtilisin family serine protease
VRVHSTYLDGVYQDPGKHLEHLKGWALWSGTSFAAPHVAAQIARLVHGGLTARQAAHQVLASARWEPGIGPVLIPAS